MLKHVLTPEEVDHVSPVAVDGSKTKLESVPNWPCLGHDWRHSAQTVEHIGNVVDAIFAHARKRVCYSGDNPRPRQWMACFPA